MNIENPFKSGLFRNIIFLEILTVFFIIILYLIFKENQYFELTQNQFTILTSDLVQIICLSFVVRKYNINIKYFFNNQKIVFSQFIKETKMVYYFIPFIYLITFIAYLNKYFPIDEPDELFKLKEITNLSFLYHNLIIFFATCIFAPIIEEILFRGILLHRLLIKWNIRDAVIVSSLFFGILHGTSFIYISILGMIFSLIYLRTKNLYYTIFAHSIYNFIIITTDYVFAYYDLSYIASLSVLSTILTTLFAMTSIVYLLVKIVKFLENNFPKSINVLDAPYFSNAKIYFKDVDIILFEPLKIKERFFKKLFTLKRISIFLVSFFLLGLISIVASEFFLQKQLPGSFEENELVQDVQINTTKKGSQKNPSIAVDTSLDGYIVWQSENQDGDDNGIYLKKINNENKLGEELQVNQTTEGDQYNPYISYVGEDKFLVVWQSKNAEKISIVGRLINNNGKYLGNEFIIGNTNNEKAKPIILSNAKNCSCEYYVFWKNNDTKSISLREYEINSSENLEYEIKIPQAIKYENIRFDIRDQDILMTGKEGNSIFLYKVNLDKKAIEKITKVSDTGVNPNIHSGDKSIVTISWEDSRENKEGYQIKAKNYKASDNYKEQKFKTDIIKESETDRYKKPSSIYLNNTNVSLWQNKDEMLYKSSLMTLGYLMLNIFNIVNDEGIFMYSNLDMSCNCEIQANNYAYNQQENYAFDSFSEDDTSYIAVTWQSKNQDGDDWGIFANIFSIEGSDISQNW